MHLFTTYKPIDERFYLFKNSVQKNIEVACEMTREYTNTKRIKKSLVKIINTLNHNRMVFILFQET